MKITNITYFCEGEDIDGDEEFLHTLQLSPIHTKIYKKAVKEGCLYDTCLQDNDRSDNSFAVLNNGKFVRLENFILDQSSRSEFKVCHDIVTTNFGRNYKILKKISISSNNRIIPTSYINRICVCIKIFDTAHLCPVPNLLKY